jgi:hypothetical protein
MIRTRHPAIDAVSALIRARPDVIDTDTGPVRRQQPCLLQMLVESLEASRSGRGAGGHGAGTLPLNTAAWDLLAEIDRDTHAWARLLGIDPAPYAVADTPRPGKPTTPPIGKLLRADAVAAATTAQDRIADVIIRGAHRWTRQIGDIIAEQPEQRDVRGANCPGCGWAITWEERDDPGSRRRDDGRGRFVVPALVLVLPRDQDEERSLYCRACGWWASLGDVVIRLSAHELVSVWREAA